jgi:hypothetical protein
MALISKVVITGVSTIPEAGIILTEPNEPERNNVVDEADPNIYQEIIVSIYLLENEFLLYKLKGIEFPGY